MWWAVDVKMYGVHLEPLSEDGCIRHGFDAKEREENGDGKREVGSLAVVRSWVHVSLLVPSAFACRAVTVQMP